MRPLRIVTTGLAATYPVGGVFWDYLQYPLGFARLGHQVLYVEDTQQYCYDPDAATFVAGGARNAAWLAARLAELDYRLAGSWFFRDFEERTYGRSWEDVVRFCRSADLFLNISGSCHARDEYLAAARTAYVDSDPMYTQEFVAAYQKGELTGDARWRADMVRRHDLFFSFAENVGRPGCKVPTALFDWIPTRQPVVLDQFDGWSIPPARRRPTLTTVLSWTPKESGPVIDGVAYGGKGVELMRLLDVPSRSVLPIELAVSGGAPVDLLREKGFRVVPARSVSADPWAYRDYLARSAGEWSVAKHAYVASDSGWFSCRSACYLALGVPVVVEDTGFSRNLPTGEGLFAFHTAEEAVAAIARIAAEPERQAAAARRVASEFDAKVVLGKLLAAALG